MFLACIFIAPIAAIIPAAATSAALIYVGALMLQGLGKLDFGNIDEIVPVFIMLLAMPVSGSIGHGIGLAMIMYTCIKVFSGRAKGNDPAGIKNMLSKEAMKGYGYPENFERLQRCEELARVKNCTVSQLALAWLFRQELNVFAIVSSTSMERMKDNIKALELDLSEEELRYLGDSSFMRSQK